MEAIEAFWEKEWCNLSFKITLAAVWSEKGIWKGLEGSLGDLTGGYYSTLGKTVMYEYTPKN